MTPTDEQVTLPENKAEKSKSKVSIQNILLAGIFITATIALFVANRHAASLGPMAGGTYELISIFIIVISVVAGVIIVSVVSGIISSGSFVFYRKNKKQLTLLEEKSKKRWHIFDIVSFLVVPIAGITIYSVGNYTVDIRIPILIAIFIILASGVKTVMKNEGGSILSRISGWFLIILGILLLFFFLLFSFA